METRLTIHFVDPSSRLRAELSRIVLGLGYHSEVYDNLGELAQRPLGRGIILSRDEPASGGMVALMQALESAEIWLPVIALSEHPTIERTVAAMKAGVLDYFHLPLDIPQFDEALRRIADEAAESGRMRRRMFEARHRIAHLSNREREVLDLLAAGHSNKEIARKLDISPRTVEIHRANMMAKLGARHAAEAVRVSIEAQLDRREAA